MMTKEYNLMRAILVGAIVLGFETLPARAQFGSSSRRSLRQSPPNQTAFRPSPTPKFGDPYPNLSADQLAEFNEGLDDFQEEDTPASGLGPVFNNVSCAACHSSPSIGGGSAILETRFGRLVNGNFDPLAQEGGSLMATFAINPACQEVLPKDANVVAKRQTTPLYGLGLIEAIPDSAILQNASQQKPDGVSGRVAQVVDVVSGQTRVGRFGWKAQQATLLAFSGDAYLNEVGITSRYFPKENMPNGSAALLAKYDKAPDPEDDIDPATGKADIDHFTDYMRYLAPPPQLPLTTSAKAGLGLFLQTGCAACHTPVMLTGSSKIQALDHKPVPLFSDLLLHDMGSLGDGIGQASAGPREMKTPPLWGLRASAPYLHDGRAATADQAIRAHDGEGSRARDRYRQLSPADRQQLLDFLNTI